ncbi:MAG: exodeoxyribonuclease VII large subunit [Gammaproteobacteria bacterium]|nr:exodeoxyribonuclease VII large subunit [Gammaproteobacteria bacterium]
MTLATGKQSQRSVLSVSELNRETKRLLESSFPLVWVEGELSNITHARSGHLYFTLKDRDAAVQAAMFRNRNIHLDFTPEEGMQVLVRAKVSLYEPRGNFQLIAEHMEEAGAGALQRAYEALKKKLAEQGLFEAAHKQALPRTPQRIGVVTSPTGAAIRDILTVLKRRFPAIEVVLYPVQVQGETAAAQIARAIGLANRRAECDVLIVGRGGGSLEDLWAFNEEIVARAIYESNLPVVSAVGHEIDFTIADFVADLRAPTPSAAAETLSPDGAELLRKLTTLQGRLGAAMTGTLRRHEDRLHHLGKRLRHPGQRLQELAQRIDELESRLHRNQELSLQRANTRLEHLSHRLRQNSPALHIGRQQERVIQLHARLHKAMHYGSESRNRRLQSLVRALDAVSPLAVLARGFAIIRDGEDGKIIKDSSTVSAGDTIEAKLHKGRLQCTVDAIESDD